MVEKPLLVRLEVVEQHAGQYILICDSLQYLVILNLERNVIVSEWLRRLPPILMDERDPAGSRDPQDLKRNLGTWLWQALFPKSAPSQQRETLIKAFRTGRTPLLLTLPDSLAALPWELLYDPDQTSDWAYLAHRRPLLRLTASESRSTISPLTPPLRVLLLISSPLDLGENTRIDVESERAAIEQATYKMRKAGHLYLRVEDIVTQERVQDALIAFHPHIVHYIGHGVYDEHHGGILLWEDKQGHERDLSAAEFVNLLYPYSIYAVVLHACQTGRNIARVNVPSFAQTLVHGGIPVVLAQQANITYESSQQASRTWYAALAAGRGFAEAIFEVRRALAQAEYSDWAVPILQVNASSPAPLLTTSTSSSDPDPLLINAGAATDLPAPTGTFVGRHSELRALHLMLEQVPSKGPVIGLITGPAGIGKSTLIAQAVARYGGAYKAALTLRCQGYQGIDLFLQRIGEFLKRLNASSFLERCLPDPTLSVEAKIEEAISSLNTVGPVLLVVDNLESVQNDDQTLSDHALLHLFQQFLLNLRGGRVLITGRFVVKDMLPQGKFAAYLMHLRLEELSPYEANQLLLRHPELAHLSELVREKLVREFGGLPYVYDLLSSKASTQNLEQIYYEIRTYGVEGEEQKEPTEERQQRAEWQSIYSRVTEFATLEVIFRRLPEASQTLLTQLTVLQQPFPLEAIEEGLDTSRHAWKPLLDWSLLYEDTLEQTFHLHGITRSYAERLLDESGRLLVCAQLAAWYEHYADQESHNLTDFLEAYRLWRAAGNMRQAGQLVTELARLLVQKGLYSRLSNLCTTTLNDLQKSDEGDELLEGRTRHILGVVTALRGRYKEAAAYHQQSLAIAEQLGEKRNQATSLYELGNIAWFQREYAEARRLYQESVGIHEQLGDRHGRAAFLYVMGNIALSREDFEEAQRLYQQSLSLFEQVRDQGAHTATLAQLGTVAKKLRLMEKAQRLYHQSLDSERDLYGRASTLQQLGILNYEEGKPEQALSLFQQSLAITEQLEDRETSSSLLVRLALLAYKYGEYEQARHFCQQSLALSEQLENQSIVQAYALQGLGLLAQVQEEYEEARHSFQHSLDISTQLGYYIVQAECLYSLGTLARIREEYKEARLLLQHSLDISIQRRNRSLQVECLFALGDIASCLENHREARRLFQRCFSISRQAENQSIQGEVLFSLGGIALLKGNYNEARRLFQKCLTLCEQTGDQDIQAKALFALGGLAYSQQQYEEARRCCQQSLSIREQLGDQSGRAECLYALGTLEDQEGNLKKALMYLFQVYTLRDALDTSTYTLVRRMMARIHCYIGEAEFMIYWRSFASNRPLTDVLEQHEIEKAQGDLLERLKLPELVNEVATIVLQGTAENRQWVASTLIEFQQQFPEATALNRFLGCLIASSHSEMPEMAVLEPPFMQLWQTFQDAPLFLETSKLPELVSDVSKIMMQGTIEQRQQITGLLVKFQQQCPEDAPLGWFYGCLICALQREMPEATVLVPPFTRLWQTLQDTLKALP